jgi:hypothetical protein
MPLYREKVVPVIVVSMDAGAERLASFTRGALPVVPPLGRLPADVRGRDALLGELQQTLTRRKGVAALGC